MCWDKNPSDASSPAEATASYICHSPGWDFLLRLALEPFFDMICFRGEGTVLFQGVSPYWYDTIIPGILHTGWAEYQHITSCCFNLFSDWSTFYLHFLLLPYFSFDKFKSVSGFLWSTLNMPPLPYRAKKMYKRNLSPCEK